ncbi:hypothetical protein [Massilia timonae]|uniref:hypothetical protein n=1 Tax=Massilia timonae TaxID=47229 RepID=UPI00115FE3C7|nr:hypothetical protein [Massilia timonae]
MFILNDGRGAFLEFLRNLTPQTLLLSIAFVVGARLDLEKFDLENFEQPLIFYAFLLFAGLAGWANCAQFLEKSFFHLDRVKRATKTFRKLGYCGQRLFISTLKYAAKRKPGVFVEVVVVLGVLELGQVALFFAAMSSASAILLNLQ